MTHADAPWTLTGADGTHYARLSKLVQKGNTWFAALEALPDYARVGPFFEAMAAHLESHGVPAGGDVAASLSALGLHLLDPNGARRDVKDLFIVEELVTFSMAR